MKIVFITQNEAPFRMKWIDEIAKYFQVVVFHTGEYEKNFNADFLTYKPERAVVYNMAEEGKTSFDLNMIIKEKADIYILDGYGFRAQQELIIKLWLKKIPFLLSLDGGFIRKENIFKKKIKEFIISRAAAYLSTSKETDAFIRYYVKEDKPIYRHLFSSIMSEDVIGYPEQKEKKCKRKELGLGDEFIIVAVGKFIPVKGFDILIKAAGLLKGDFKIYFIGSDKSDVYEEYIFSDMIGKIRFIGFCDENKLNKYYRAADIFVLPTRGDVWGLVVGEAMAQGLPIITTNMCIAGNAMVKNGINGYIVATENYRELANKIQLLMNDVALRERMGRKNVEDVRPYCIDLATKEDIKSLRTYIEK